MKGLFFFESVGVPGGSPELGKGNSGWVPSFFLFSYHRILVLRKINSISKRYKSFLGILHVILRQYTVYIIFLRKCNNLILPVSYYLNT